MPETVIYESEGENKTVPSSNPFYDFEGKELEYSYEDTLEDAFQRISKEIDSLDDIPARKALHSKLENKINTKRLSNNDVSDESMGADIESLISSMSLMNGKDSEAVFELYQMPESNLEYRMAKLEAAIGDPFVLQKKVQTLQNQVQLLSDDEIDRYSEKIIQLQSQIDADADLKKYLKTIPDNNVDIDIDDILSYLIKVQTLHQKANDWNNNLEFILNEQKVLKRLLLKQQETFSRLEQEMAKNDKLIESNFRHLNERLNKLNDE